MPPGTHVQTGQGAGRRDLADGVGESRQEPGLGPEAAGVVDIGGVVAAAQDQLGALQVIDDAGIGLRLLAAQVDRVRAAAGEDRHERAGGGRLNVERVIVVLAGEQRVRA